MRVFFLFSYWLILSCSTLVHAEYRVFALKITKPNADATQAPIERTVISNLDPDQYRGYYPVEPNETITYTDTWRCFGRTGEFQDYCPKPARQPTESEKSAPQKAQIQNPVVSKQNSP